MSEPITNVDEAVAALGALPMPVGPPLDREGMRAAYIEALDNAHQSHPCPATGRPFWTGCVHYDESGRTVGVGSCHSERRADAVLAVRDVELERLRARVAELEAERHVTNEALDDAVQALRGRHEAEEECDHPNGYGPNGCAGCGASAPADDEDDVTPQVTKLRALLAGQRTQIGGV